MNRTQFKQFILEYYDAQSDHPWAKYPNYEVFRHDDNRKWFAVLMEVPKNKLGLSETDSLDIVNFKCDPVLIGTLREEAGFFPAYHMSKENWITAALDGSVPEEKLKLLLDMSYRLTEKKAQSKSGGIMRFQSY